MYKRSFAVLGAGFSGLALCWFLLERAHPGIEITLFDQKEIGCGTSGIATGLLHPFGGAQARFNRFGQEGIDETWRLIKVAEEALNKPVIAHERGIFRPALSQRALSDFSNAHRKYPSRLAWLEPEESQQKIPGIAPCSGLWIPEGITVYSREYLKGLWRACQAKGVRFVHQRIHHLGELDAFDHIVLATGADAPQFAECSALKMGSVRGQLIELRWHPSLQVLPAPVNGEVYLLMTPSKTSCFLGATYERDQNHDDVDLDVATSRLLPKGISMFPMLSSCMILEGFAGRRATTPDHLPLAKHLSMRLSVLTGMGSKGLLYHALFAKRLVDQLIF